MAEFPPEPTDHDSIKVVGTEWQTQRRLRETIGISAAGVAILTGLWTTSTYTEVLDPAFRAASGVICEAAGGIECQDTAPSNEISDSWSELQPQPTP